MLKSIALILVSGITLAAQATKVNNQSAAFTQYPGTTAPGLEVDLGRSWTEYSGTSISFVQWRLGLTKNLDVRFTKDSGAIRVGGEATDKLMLGVQKSWGRDYDKWLFLATQKFTDHVYMDVNFGTSKNTTTKEHTNTISASLYYAGDKWSYGAEVASINTEGNVSKTVMVWTQYSVNNKIGLWGGVNRDLSIDNKPLTLTLGTSVRF